jgi:hypothetical protein
LEPHKDFLCNNPDVFFKYFFKTHSSKIWNIHFVEHALLGDNRQ